MKEITFITYLLFLNVTVSFSQTTKFNPYIPQVPLQAYRDVGIAKQKLYEERFTKIQDLIYDCANYIDELIEDYPEKGQIANAQLNKFLKQLNTNKYDVSDFNTFNSITQYIYQLKNYAKNLRAEGREEKQPQTKMFNPVQKESTNSAPSYSGYISTYTSAPIYDTPDIVNGKTVYNVPINTKVRIIEKVKENYYKVEVNSIIGYLHQGMIKPE